MRNYSENIQRSIAVLGIVAGALSLANCRQGETTPKTETARIVTDSDHDTVLDAWDVLPGKDDLADDDKDYVINGLDRYPGIDDKRQDNDRDGIADYRDTFFGDNSADADNDGIPNGLDLQPFSFATTGGWVQMPLSSGDQQKMQFLVLNEEMRRHTGKKVLSSLLVPNEIPNNWDGDIDPDFYDTAPADPAINSHNQPYDKAVNEYWLNDPKFNTVDPYSGQIVIRQ